MSKVTAATIDKIDSFCGHDGSGISHHDSHEIAKIHNVFGKAKLHSFQVLSTYNKFDHEEYLVITRCE